jgi:hypothetical protein
VLTDLERCGIAKADVQLLTVFDVADEVDLGMVERILRSDAGPGGTPDAVGRLALERQSDAVAISNPPVTFQLGDRSLELTGTAYTASASVSLYDFGALAARWSFPIPDGSTFGDLVDLSVTLDAPTTRAWLADALAADADQAMARVGAALTRPTRQEFAEHLTLYVVSEFDRAMSAAELLEGDAMAQLVTGERITPSAQLSSETRAAALSYTDADLVVIGYDQAFVFDPTSTADIRALLEFALAQVLELGYYDALLDVRLAQLGEAVGGPARHARWWGLGGSTFEKLRREVLVQHVDLVQVLERVTTAVKLTDDRYYARIYGAAMRVFRAEELISATNRKLELLFRTYTMLADEVDSHVAHRLEWVIILLIAIEIILGLAQRL